MLWFVQIQPSVGTARINTIFEIRDELLRKHNNTNNNTGYSESQGISLKLSTISEFLENFLYTSRSL